MTGGGATPARLDALILEAHAAGDQARLAALYDLAGGREAAAGRTDAACFFWTQGWICALDAGEAPLAAALERRLHAAGRMPARGL